MFDTFINGLAFAVLVIMCLGLMGAITIAISYKSERLAGVVMWSLATVAAIAICYGLGIFVQEVLK